MSEYLLGVVVGALVGGFTALSVNAWVWAKILAHWKGDK